jgi:hypothetical protein
LKRGQQFGLSQKPFEGMREMRLKAALPSVIATVAFTVLAAGLPAQQTKTLFTGRTSVKLSSTFTSAVTGLGVSVGRVFPTEMWDGAVTFPVTGGAIDLDTASGNILHSGGLTLKAGDTKVVLQSFIIDTTTGKPMITGLVSVNGKLLGRIPLFDLTLPAGFSLPLHLNENRLVLKGVWVTLDATAAGALDAVFHVNAFTAGFPIGTAQVVAYGAGW